MIKRIFSLALCAVLMLGLFSGCAPENGNLTLSVNTEDLTVSALVSGTAAFSEDGPDSDVKAERVVLLYAVTDEQKAALAAVGDTGTDEIGYMSAYPGCVVSQSVGDSVNQSLASSGKASVSLSCTLSDDCNGKDVVFRAAVLGKVKDNGGNLLSGYKTTGAVTKTVQVRPRYDITVDPAIVNGTVTTDPAGKALEGQTITVTANPEAGYTMGTITVKTASDGDVTVTDGKFVMPAEAVVVSADFELIPTYAVADGTDDPNGTISIDKKTAQAGETVTVTDNPKAGYTLGTLTVKTASNADVTVTDRKFVMPAEDVTVAASFEALPTFKINDDTKDTHGKVTIDKEETYAGDTVTVTAEPNDGYRLAAITVKTASNADVTVTDGKFVMPAEAVSVVVTFEVKPVHKITNTTTDVGGTVTIDKTEAREGDVVTVTGVPKEGYNMGTITVRDADGKPVVTINGKFTMPDCDVTVTVTFPAKPVFIIINATTDTNGTVSIDKTSAWEGQEVTVTATPKEGYELENITVKTVGGTDVSVDVGKFLMPAADVNVTVTFKPAHVHEFGTAWKSNTEEHWHECACGEKTDVAAHTFGAAYKCVVCSFTNQYTITQGANKVWDKKTTTGHTLVSNADYTKFVKVTVDGAEVDAKYFTSRASSGATSVTLKRTYLVKLSVGTHKVRIQSNDGSAVTNLTITNKSGTVKTGDDSNLALWLILMLSAMIVMTVTMLYDRLKYPYGRTENKK